MDASGYTDRAIDLLLAGTLRGPRELPDDRALEALVARAEGRRHYLAFWLATYPRAHLARRLRCSSGAVRRLLLSGAPRHGRWRRDVRNVAYALGLDAGALADLLLEAEASTSVAASPVTLGLLARLSGALVPGAEQTEDLAVREPAAPLADVPGAAVGIAGRSPTTIPAALRSLWRAVSR